MYKKIIIVLFFIFGVSIDSLLGQDFEKVILKDLRIELPAKKVDKSSQTGKLSSSLDRLYKLHEAKENFRQFATQSQLQLIDDRVVVTILPKPGVTTADIDENNLMGFGARIQSKAKHSMRVEIPVSLLENVATKVKGIGIITEPIKPIEHAITSEGVALMNADNWQTSGYEGSGVKVAVIDGGFVYLTEAQANGDIPSSYVSHDFTGNGLETETPHGTAVAEAIFDVVPQAEFYLYKIGDATDFENAKDSCISNGVEIVNHSMGWYNASYYDGTGTICDIANDAISNGIAWVNSAGNDAETHYRSVFDDTNGTHDFSGSGGNINFFGPGDGSAYVIPAGEYIDVFLNWDAYPNTTEDYALYLYRWTGGNWIEVASSINDQAGGNLPPTERISYLTQNTSPYGVVIVENSTTMDHDFTLFNWIASFNYQTASSSITDPASATDVVTVGAIDRNDYTGGPQEDFSSQGPTTDDRTKPDVAAPDNCNSYAYEYWNGTSLSSPHTAGVCALIKSRYPGYSNSDIRNYLYTDCTVDLGTSGKDNIYGWGKVVMPDISLAVTSPDGGEIWQVGSTHDITWTSSGTSGGVRIQYSSNNGSTWSDVIASIPDTGVYSWTIPGTPSDSCLVRITDTIGSPSDTSDSLFTILDEAPASPQNLTATPGDQQVTLRWSPNTEPDLHKYNIYRGTASPASTLIDSVVASSPPDTFYVNTGLNNGRKYFYRITAVDIADNESDFSEEVNATPEGLIAYYPFNGNANDESGNGNNGTVNGATLSTDRFGNTEQAYLFDGVNDYINCGNNDILKIYPPLSIEAWIYPYVVEGETGKFIISKGNQAFRYYSLCIQPNGQVYFDCESAYGPAISNRILEPNNWYHIVGVHDGSASYVYINSVLEDTTNAPFNNPGNSNDSLTIGIEPSYMYSSTHWFQGMIDDIRIYNRALSESEIQSLYNSIITVTSPNGDENWQVGSIHDITWMSSGTSGTVNIVYSTNNGSSWTGIIENMPDTGAFPWLIPDTPSDNCLVMIADTNGSLSDTSDAVFTILFVSGVTAPELPEVYSMSVKGIATGNQLEVRNGVPEKATVRFRVYDIKGTKIEEFSEESPAGFYSVKINMGGKPAGVYFLKMEANGKKFTKTSKFVLM